MDKKAGISRTAEHALSKYGIFDRITNSTK
jgi:hypothetical protein